jgi:hypothetical protein
LTSSVLFPDVLSGRDSWGGTFLPRRARRRLPPTTSFREVPPTPSCREGACPCTLLWPPVTFELLSPLIPDAAGPRHRPDSCPVILQHPATSSTSTALLPHPAVDMPAQTGHILSYALIMAWSILSLTPRAMKTLVFDAIFPTERVWREAMHRASPQFACGLMLAIFSATAPTIDFFKTLPIVPGKLWAVYVLVMEKDGHRPRVYIGSGTSSTDGAKLRMHTYARRTKSQFSSGIPCHVQKSFKDGFTLTHRGYLVWAPIPRPAYQYELRALFLVLECLFTLIFWAMESRTKDYFMPRQCPWPINSFSYDGLCNHFSINEGYPTVHEHAHLSPAEFDALVLERKHANYCDVCVLSFPCLAKLKTHKLRQIHIDMALGITKIPKGRGGSQINIKSKKFFCKDCNKASPSAKRLAIHLNGPRHAKKLRLLAARK